MLETALNYLIELSDDWCAPVSCAYRNDVISTPAFDVDFDHEGIDIGRSTRYLMPDDILQSALQQAWAHECIHGIGPILLITEDQDRVHEGSNLVIEVFAGEAKIKPWNDQWGFGGGGGRKTVHQPVSRPNTECNLLATMWLRSRCIV